MALKDISIVRSDTDTVSVTFKDKCSGDVLDITGWTIWFTVRDEVPAKTVTDDTGALISKVFTTGGSSGVATFEFTSTDTNQDIGSYLYDIQFKDADGNIDTLGVANFKITGDITRSI